MNKILPLLIFCIICKMTAAQVVVPNYEFRAVWVATVENIDWPSSKNNVCGATESGVHQYAGYAPA
jgi:hypothetical protein